MRHAPSTPLLPRLPSRPAPRVVRRPPSMAPALLAVLALSSMAAAWGPGVDAAIGWTGGSRTAAALARVQAAEDALAEAQWGFAARFVAEPAVAYGADVEDRAQLAASLALELDVAWEHDAVSVLAARVDLEKARISLQDARRTDTKEAFELHVALLRAGLAEVDALADVDHAHEDLAARQAEGDAVEIAHAELELRSAELDAADAAAELAVAEDALRRAALEPWPDFQPVLFAIPPLAVTEVPAHRILTLEVARATRDLERQRAFGVVQDLALVARYESRTDRYQLDASVGLDDGRPVAAIGAAYRPQQDDQWSVTLGARIVVDASTLRGTTDAEAAVAAAQAELQDLQTQVERLAGDAARRARVAAERFAIAWDTLRAREREVARLPDAGSAAVRSDASLRRHRDRLLLAWLRYVEEVDDYLALIGADWQIVGRLE